MWKLVINPAWQAQRILACETSDQARAKLTKWCAVRGDFTYTDTPSACTDTIGGRLHDECDEGRACGTWHAVDYGPTPFPVC